MKLLNFKRLSRRTKLLSASLLLVLTTLVVVPGLTGASFGPGRETKAYTDGVAGFDHVTFNSFTGVPGIGDERAFFTGRYTDTGSYTDPLAQVKNGDTLTLRVYVHNGADESLNASGVGVAKNTKVRVALPTASAKAQQATAYISADNAQPGTVYDTVDFGSANGGNFQLEYVPGSAHLKGNYVDTALSDSVVTTGALVGTKGADGKVDGCFKQLVYVTLQVKVKMPNYSLDKQVRMKGQTSADWAETKATKAGDTTQWMMTFKNTGSTSLKSVNIVDQVPAGLTVVPGSVKLINGNYPNGYTYPAGAVQDGGRTINVNIGDYGANAAGVAYVIFDTTVDKPAANVCTTQKIVNKAYATPSGLGAIWDVADVTVAGNVCEQTTNPSYACTDLTLTKGTGRTVTAVTTYTAKDGATYKSTSYNYGDGSAATADTTHTYAQDGTYTVKSTVSFTVNGEVKTATSPACEEQVTFTTTTGQPVYSCDELTLTQSANRTVTASVKYTAKDGATFKTVTYNFGDGDKSVFTTDQTTKQYQYGADGTYTVTAKVLFTVNGVDKYGADNQACAKTVTFTTTPTPPETPVTPQTPQVLPSTGAGSVAGIFVAVVALSTLGYRLLLSRKV